MMNSEEHPFKILLGDDGSNHSQAAVKLLTELPERSSKSIQVVSVLSQREISGKEIIEKVLEQTKSQLSHSGYMVNTELRIGNPPETLIDSAHQFHPNLIVLGAIGLRATLGILLGGVAQQIVEYADWPVLIVRAPFTGLNKVLLITDGSKRSQKTLDYFCHFPLPEQTEIHVMHVMPPLPSPEFITRAWPMGSEAIPPLPPVTLTEEINRWEAEETLQGQNLLDQTIENLLAAGLSSTGVLKRGDAATEIIKYSKEEQIDLIVTGSRGLSQVQSWLLGSVSRKLIHYAGCSVLLVK